MAPSTELRRWFRHDPARWEEFCHRYRAELVDNPESVECCLTWCCRGPVRLLFAAKDHERNQGVVLREYLAERLSQNGINS